MNTQPSSPEIAELERAAKRRVVTLASGGTVVWRSFGRGAPLVLLHGGHGSWLHWARNIVTLASDFELWVPDMPGYGDSASPAEPTLDALVAATLESLDAVIGSQTPIGVAGFSFGGLVAAHLALRRPRVTRLALLGCAGHGGTRRPRGELRSWRDAYERGDLAALHKVMRHNLLMHMLAGDEADATAIEIHTRSCLNAHFHSRTISRSGGLADCLARYAGALLLAWGEHDITAVPDELAPALLARTSDASAVIIPDAGHWVQYQQAEYVNALLAGWMGSARTTAAGR